MIFFDIREVIGHIKGEFVADWHIAASLALRVACVGLIHGGLGEELGNQLIHYAGLLRLLALPGRHDHVWNHTHADRDRELFYSAFDSQKA
jgi:hypothetical protein